MTTRQRNTEDETLHQNRVNRSHVQSSLLRLVFLISSWVFLFHFDSLPESNEQIRRYWFRSRFTCSLQTSGWHKEKRFPDFLLRNTFRLISRSYCESYVSRESKQMLFTSALATASRIRKEVLSVCLHFSSLPHHGITRVFWNWHMGVKQMAVVEERKHRRKGEWVKAAWNIQSNSITDAQLPLPCCPDPCVSSSLSLFLLSDPQIPETDAHAWGQFFDILFSCYYRENSKTPTSGKPVRCWMEWQKMGILHSFLFFFFLFLLR